MLTMALIGCLPDNVQQAIKSFSIRHGKQHITFAFPFMEETLRSFCGCADPKEGQTDSPMAKMDAGHQPSVLFFDECLEVVHGFQTFVTILPHLNRTWSVASLLETATASGHPIQRHELICFYDNEDVTDHVLEVDFVVFFYPLKCPELMWCHTVKKYTSLRLIFQCFHARPCARSSLPVVLLTLYQRDTSEGICRHFQCLFQTLVEQKTADLLKLPIMVADLSTKIREMVLDICSETLCELQAENLASTYPEKNAEQLLQLTKEKFLRPSFLSYPEFLRRNTQEVLRQLTSTDPSYFLSLMDLLQSNSCSVLDYKKIDLMFKSPAIDPAIRDLWRIWGHEQISRKVFPAGLGAPVSKLGPLYGPPGGTGPEAVVNMGTLSHVPVKEGLQSVIKCLKSQDISQIKIKSPEHDSSRYQSCGCSVCKIQAQPRRNSRFRLYGDFAKQNLVPTSPETSAFHLPMHKRPIPEDFYSRTFSSFHLQSEVSTFSYHHRHSFIPTDGSTRVPHHTVPNADVTRSSYCSSSTSSSHVVQPVPQYLPLNLKAFSQRMLYGYQMLSKPQYPMPIPARPSH